jgi:hypothetical protein
MKYPLVWGDADANESEAVLAERHAEGEHLLMWYVGRIVHDDVFPVLGDDGQSIVKPISEIDQ